MSDLELPMYQGLVWHLSKRPANRQWLLNILSSITGGAHPFFDKNYRPPKIVRERVEYQIDNKDGFFNNIPISK